MHPLHSALWFRSLRLRLADFFVFFHRFPPLPPPPPGPANIPLHILCCVIAEVGKSMVIGTHPLARCLSPCIVPATPFQQYFSFMKDFFTIFYCPPHINDSQFVSSSAGYFTTYRCFHEYLSKSKKIQS